MLYLSAALFCEAEPFIKELNLKKELIYHKFQIFSNQDFKLIITGTGPVAAACGLTYLLTLYPPESGDLLLSIGICTADGNQELGSIFLCNKIREESSGRDFYPDLLFKHPFQEASVITVSHVLEKKERFHFQNIDLADMEASSVYQCGSRFFQSHEMFFLKIISDRQEPEKLTPTLVSGLISPHVSSVLAWAGSIHSALHEESLDFSEIEQQKIRRIADSLQLSVTMGFQLRQYCRYYRSLHRDLVHRLEEFYEGFPSECLPFNKKEGKIHFERLKLLLMEP